MWMALSGGPARGDEVIDQRPPLLAPNSDIEHIRAGALLPPHVSDHLSAPFARPCSASGAAHREPLNAFEKMKRLESLQPLTWSAREVKHGSADGLRTASSKSVK
jgi:hypothetical protein